MPPRYVTVESLKAHLLKTGVEDDTTLEDALMGVETFVDRYTGRTFDKTAELTRVFDADGGERIRVGEMATLPTAVTYAGNWTETPTALMSADYLVLPRYPQNGEPYTEIRRAPGYLWPASPGLVYVTAEWGWSAVPEDLKTVVRSLAARWWNHVKQGFTDVVGTDPQGDAVYSRLLTQNERLYLQGLRGPRTVVMV